MYKPAIVTVGYNRPNDLERLLNSIAEASYPFNDITLVISIDKANNEDAVVSVADSFKWDYGEKVIRRFPERQGLRKHVLQCGDLAYKYGAVIILEDDLLVSPDFYQYTVSALEMYGEDEKVTGVSLYSHEWNGYANRYHTPIINQYDVYMGQFSISWGQCWTDRWWRNFKNWYEEQNEKLLNDVDIPRDIDLWSDQSWGKYFAHYIVKKNLFYVVPYVSTTTNFSDPGQHVSLSNNVYQVRFRYGSKTNYSFPTFSEAIKYDMYFENIELRKKLSEELHEDVCVNLSGIDREYGLTRYLLSTESLPYKRIRSYGAQLRPIELNVFYRVPGEDIFLYDMCTVEKKPKSSDFNILRYEIRGIPLNECFIYSVGLFIRKAKRAVTNRVRKRK